MCTARFCNYILVAILAAFVALPKILNDRDAKVNISHPRPLVPSYGAITTIRHDNETMDWVRNESGRSFSGALFAPQVDMYYEVQREGCVKGKNFVIMPGTNTQTWTYDGLIREIRKLGFCTLVFDYRAHGRTEDTPGVLSPELLLADAVAITKKVFGDEQVHIFGWSLGGALTYLWGIYFPEKVESLVIYGMNSCFGKFSAEGECAKSFGFAKWFFSQEPIVRLLGHDLEYNAGMAAIKFIDCPQLIEYFYTLRQDSKVKTPNIWSQWQADKYHALISKIDSPVLMLNGEYEVLASGTGQLEMDISVKRMARATAHSLVPGYSHMMLLEPGGLEKIMEALLPFYEANS